MPALQASFSSSRAPSLTASLTLGARTLTVASHIPVPAEATPSCSSSSSIRVSAEFSSTVGSKAPAGGRASTWTLYHSKSESITLASSPMASVRPCGGSRRASVVSSLRARGLRDPNGCLCGVCWQQLGVTASSGFLVAPPSAVDEVRDNLAVCLGDLALVCRYPPHLFSLRYHKRYFCMQAATVSSVASGADDVTRCRGGSVRVAATAVHRRSSRACQVLSGGGAAALDESHGLHLSIRVYVRSALAARTTCRPATGSVSPGLACTERSIPRG